MHIFGIVISEKIYMPIIIILVAMLLDKICQTILKSKITKKLNKLNSKKMATINSVIANLIRYAIYIIALLAILKVFGINTAALVTGLGVVSLVLGLALQDILKDILAGVSIIFEGQLAIGDYVKIGNFQGTVIMLGLKSTKIQAFTGEIKIISNRNITDVINYSLDKTLAMIDIPVSYESDLDKVEKILKVTAANLNDKIPSLVNELEILGVQELADSSVVFRIIGKCKPAKHFEVERTLKKEFKCALDKNGIKIPYPQVEVHNAK